MKLSDVAVGRDNNFNLIRFSAAFSVLISHGFAIVLGPEAFEPLERMLGYTLGEIAVDVFFISSGFLVCGSLLRLNHLRRFARARALRIFPALAVALALTTLLMGPLASTLSVYEYFRDPQWFVYLIRNMLLFGGVEHHLPGVFTDLPQSGVVNGSLWTLPFEVWCYAALAITWAVLRKPRLGFDALPAFLIAAAIGSFVLFHATRVHGMEIHHGFRLFFMFFSGASFYVLKDRVPFDWRIAAALSIAVIASARDAASFVLVYPLCAAYLVLCAAYWPGRLVRNFNRLGDYSYGIYIYAFPMQQLVVLLSPPDWSLGALVGITAAFTFLAAFVSWHVVEKPFLARVVAPEKLTHPAVQTPAAP